MENMFLQDIKEGKGAVFIDAHSDAVKRLMTIVPEEHVERCIYFNPGDPEWVPSWNPLFVPPGGDPYLMADDFVSALERVSKHWGDRLAHVLRNGLIALSYLNDATLRDLYHLVRTKSPESEGLIARIVASDVDGAVRSFWEHDFKQDYRPADLASPKHKLDPLVVGGTVSLMLSQPHSAIQFRKLMDERKVLLVDLSTIGSDAREVLGSLMLTLFMMATLSRSNIEASDRHPFSIFADEAHLFVSADAIENTIAQARKFGVSLCIAHQYLNQFKAQQVDALSTVGASILGRLDKHDSQHFSKDLQDLVEPKDLISLKPYEMIGRIGTDVVRFQTVKCEEPPDISRRQRIIEQTHNNYCIPAGNVHRLIFERQAEEPKGVLSLNTDLGNSDMKSQDLSYDEF